MPTRPAKTADDIAEGIRSLVDRIVDAKVTQEIARRGQDMAEMLAERGADMGELASDAWRESKPMRRDAAKRLSRATDDAAKWSEGTWHKSLRPALKDLWKRRTVAIATAGAAVPASKGLVDSAAARLGLRERESHHWGAFFWGLLLGAVGGAIIALLTTPKRGSEMRDELATKADEIVTKAKDDWVPMFQREGSDQVNGAADLSASMTDAAAEAGAATGEAADQAAADTAEAINETYEGVDREAQG